MQDSHPRPTWQGTLPHRIMPQADEWVAGFLLRCDEINHWSAGSTLACLRPARSPHSSTIWFNILAPSHEALAHLAQVVGLSLQHILATTYQAEMERVTGIASRLLIQTYTNFLFHLCPACIAETQLLARPLILPYVEVCRRHQLELQHKCQCGEYLKVFSRNAAPFCCHACGLHWAKLPHVAASPNWVELESIVRSYFQFLIVEGTPEKLKRVLGLIEERQMEREQKQDAPARNKKRYRYISRLLSQSTLTFEEIFSSLIYVNITLDDIDDDLGGVKRGASIID